MLLWINKYSRTIFQSIHLRCKSFNHFPSVILIFLMSVLLGFFYYTFMSDIKNTLLKNYFIKNVFMEISKIIALFLKIILQIFN